MNEAERAAGTESETAEARAPFVRALVIAVFTLFFLQLTLLAPADLEAALGFSTTALGQRWWTAVTFPLVHSEFLPLLINMGVIGLFGAHLERRWGTAEYARYFTICALGAWIASVAIAPSDAMLTGSAAPAIGTLLAFSATSGGNGFFRVGAVALPAGWLATGGTVMVLLAGMAVTRPEATLAYLVHLAGLVAGWTYLRTASSINFVRLRESVSPLPDEQEDAPPRAIPKRDARSRQQPPEDDVVARSNAAVAREAATRQVATPERRDPKTLDKLLDKVSAHGLESLTSEERTLLDELSRRLRDS
jgi:membrane associated rhomboid family serine protease